MGCCVSFIKYLLFLFNILFWLAGGAILGFGIYLRVDNNISDVITVAGVSIYYAGAISLIVFGSVMFVIGFFGCCGAIKENKCLLGTYFTLVLIIFLAQVAIAIWAFASQSSIESTIEKGISASLPINPATKPDYANAVIAVEKTFHCCGLVNGCSDWANGAASGCTCDISNLNYNCSAPPAGNCTNADQPGSPIYTTDCEDAIITFINNNIWTIGGVAIGIAVAEIFGMVFAIIMCTNKSEGYETY